MYPTNEVYPTDDSRREGMGQAHKGRRNDLLIYKEGRGGSKREEKRSIPSIRPSSLSSPKPYLLISSRENESDGIKPQCRILGEQRESHSLYWAGEGYHRHGSRDRYHLFSFFFFFGTLSLCIVLLKIDVSHLICFLFLDLPSDVKLGNRSENFV